MKPSYKLFYFVEKYFRGGRQVEGLRISKPRGKTTTIKRLYKDGSEGSKWALTTRNDYVDFMANTIGRDLGEGQIAENKKSRKDRIYFVKKKIAENESLLEKKKREVEDLNVQKKEESRIADLKRKREKAERIRKQIESDRLKAAKLAAEIKALEEEQKLLEERKAEELARKKKEEEETKARLIINEEKKRKKKAAPRIVTIGGGMFGPRRVLMSASGAIIMELDSSTRRMVGRGGSQGI
jgi:DNA polymerase III alpha subunit (gram-positive type)|tara:strand:- start:1553 stop:2272 length:720 start_codon:yes stop_codon:yes gene_type:complete